MEEEGRPRARALAEESIGWNIGAPWRGVAWRGVA
jgi:hypothetical protein